MAAAAGPGERPAADPPGACPGADSGNVSQSHSSASGLGEPEDEDASEASLSATAAAYSAYLLADRSLFSEQVRSRAAPGRRGGAGGGLRPRPCDRACRALREEGATAGTSPGAVRPDPAAGGPAHGARLPRHCREKGCRLRVALCSGAAWPRWRAGRLNTLRRLHGLGVVLCKARYTGVSGHLHLT